MTEENLICYEDGVASEGGEFGCGDGKTKLELAHAPPETPLNCWVRNGTKQHRNTQKDPGSRVKGDASLQTTYSILISI